MKLAFPFFVDLEVLGFGRAVWPVMARNATDARIAAITLALGGCSAPIIVHGVTARNPRLIA